MSKLNAACAILGALVLSSMPLAAATIASDESVTMRLGFDARLAGPNQYAVMAGGVVLLEVNTPPDVLLWVFAVAEDAWGEPDYSNILTLYLDLCDGKVSGFLPIPKELAGMTFHLVAVAQPLDKDLLLIGPEFEIAIESANN
jgi:hypothetical protein